MQIYWFVLRTPSDSWLFWLLPWQNCKKRLISKAISNKKENVKEGIIFSWRSLKNGGYLLSRLVDSTIGVVGLNFSVRNGKRWNPNAITTWNKVGFATNDYLTYSGFYKSYNQKYRAFNFLRKKFRAISKARLWRHRLYTCLLSTSSSLTTLIRKSHLVAGFALRCFQRLSDPDADTRQCSWRNNR